MSEKNWDGSSSDETSEFAAAVDAAVASGLFTPENTLDESEPAHVPAPRYRNRGNIILDSQTGQNAACAYMYAGPKAAAELASRIADLLNAHGKVS